MYKLNCYKSYSRLLVDDTAQAATGREASNLWYARHTWPAQHGATPCGYIQAVITSYGVTYNQLLYSSVVTYSHSLHLSGLHTTINYIQLVLHFNTNYKACTVNADESVGLQLICYSGTVSIDYPIQVRL